MDKKKFTSGMDSLFGDTQEPSLEQDHFLSSEKAVPDSSGEKNSSKGFKDNLVTFLQEAFEESLEQQLEQRKTKTTPTPKGAKGGLDALLRSTIEPTKIKLQNKPIRRLTISFDEKKLTKLRRIAQNKKIYLKDIIDEIVGEYLENYESNKGPMG